MVVGYDGVPDGVFDGLLQDADLSARLQTEGFHDFLARDGIVPGAIVVACFQVGKLFSNELEILQEVFLPQIRSLLQSLGLDRASEAHPIPYR